MQYDNPAARLLSILSEGKKVAATDPCRGTWAKLLDTPEGDGALLVSRIGKLMSLPQEIIERTKELYPNQQPTWQHWSHQVNAGFSSQNLNGQWQTFVQHIDPHTITYLTMSSDLLEAKSSIKRLELSKITELRGTINELMSSVLQSDSDSELKKYVIHHLRQILVAIDEYKITGALPILDAVESTIGHAYIDKKYYSYLKDTDIGKQIVIALGAVANLVTIAVGVPAITQGILMLSSHG